MKVGVLAIQGAVSEHVSVLERLGETPVLVKSAADLSSLSGLIIPGGESTTVGMFLPGGLGDGIRRLAARNVPIYGTCTGMILLGKVEAAKPKTLGLMDVTVRRNAFGRQVDSFEEDIRIPEIGKKPVHCVFIRAPVIERVGKDVNVLARCGGCADGKSGRSAGSGNSDGSIVFARQDNLLASSFHPELTSDTRVHEYFLSMRK